MSSPPLHTSLEKVLKLNKEETMPKRACPFEEDLTPQLKIHVGPNEIIDEKQKKKELTKIFDRTMTLLKLGAENYSKNATTNHQSVDKNAAYYFESPCMKQTVMNNKLQLELSTKIVLPLNNKPCTRCGKIDASTPNYCFQCFDIHCTNCLSQCSKCSELFCLKCSFTIYDNDEHIECLSCYY